ncbi:HAD family hydrolase [Clostridium sp. NSJ-49]|uniref:HAD hydrolase n=1 Tax=Clostridium disporicum TaxID=84024 RepID=A0A174KSE9_9CLOT|nr:MULTISPECIES: HAD family hydrolase [Clostridium]MBC5624411.1 HAD family hydrolase [Clostridium sp. NSJ-49]CUP13346.1 HAD hydrolase [Clostridium disporicum]
MIIIKKYILFDLDGTVTDPMIGITKSVQYALNKFDIEVEDLNELCKFIGPPLKDSFMNFYNFTEEDALNAITYYREYFSTKGLYENTVYENFEDMLISLKEKNKSLIIATSKPTVFAEKILEHFNLKKYFDFIAGSNLDNTRTKKADVISYALEQQGITEVSEIIMIGDREHDVIGAKALNIESIGVLHGYGSYDELSNSGANYIVKDVKELHSLLLSL